jgi:hypothetical protein
MKNEGIARATLLMTTDAGEGIGSIDLENA